MHFVPTMGALHEGHAHLIRTAAAMARGGEVVVSIFVNPTQFNDPADFARYPRTLEADREICMRAGATRVYAPSVEEMYPPGALPEVPPLPEVATKPGLEDRFRPGHFAGVCQVVLRLFRILRPTAALFGEKDWQQLQVIRAMTRERRLGVEIVPVATVREASGLAMSSRNRFIPAERMEQALAISGALREGSEAGMLRVLASAGLGDAVEYAVIRDAETLGERVCGRPARALIAARVGPVRLIDNEAV